MEIFKEFTFDAAHRLTKVPDGHKCSNIHGHTFIIRIYVKGKTTKETDWVIDFADIKKTFKPYLDILDHKVINEIEGLENPTSENLAKWVYRKMRGHIPNISKVLVQETPTCGCIYEGDEED